MSESTSLVLESERAGGTSREEQVGRWLGMAERWLRMAQEREGAATFRELVDAASKAQARALDVAVMGGMGEKIIDLEEADEGDAGAPGGTTTAAGRYGRGSKALRATRDRVLKIIQASNMQIIKVEATTDEVSDGGQLKGNELSVVEAVNEDGRGGGCGGPAGQISSIGESERGISDSGVRP